MKIAIVSTNEQPDPPPFNTIIASLYISSLISEGLKKRGHQIYSIVGRDSTINTEKVFSNSKSFFKVVDRKSWEELKDLRLMWQIMVPFEMDLNLTLLDFLKSNSVDIVHFHSILPFYGLPFAQRVSVPCLFTLHSTTSRLELDVMNNFLAKNIYFNSVSLDQQKRFSGLPFVGNVYNGIPMEGNFSFNKKGGSSMTIAGRIKKEKGFEEAIEVARRTNRHLRISGEVRPSQEAFSKILSDLVQKNSSLVEIESFVYHNLMGQFWGNAKLFIYPIQWEEPFGLVMIEAMACGTPVIAYARGSVPEVIKDGVTGFIVNSSDVDKRGNWIIKKTGIEGLKEAVEKIYNMPDAEYLEMRKASRIHVEENFTLEKMVSSYEKIYQEVVNRTR